MKVGTPEDKAGHSTQPPATTSNRRTSPQNLHPASQQQYESLSPVQEAMRNVGTNIGVINGNGGYHLVQDSQGRRFWLQAPPPAPFAPQMQNPLFFGPLQAQAEQSQRSVYGSSSFAQRLGAGDSADHIPSSSVSHAEKPETSIVTEQKQLQYPLASFQRVGSLGVVQPSAQLIGPHHKTHGGQKVSNAPMTKSDARLTSAKFTSSKKAAYNKGKTKSNLRDIHRDNNTSGAEAGNAQKLFFKNREQAVAGMKSPAWSPPRNDNTIPTTDKARRAWVRKLVRAFNNLDDVMDKDGPVFKRRWKDEEVVKEFYNPKEVEKVCWDIVDLAERLHREGPKVLDCYDPEFQKAIAKTQNLIFAERVNILIKLFTPFKNRCDKVMKGGVLQNYVAVPGSMIGTATSNRKANDARQQYIQVGRDMSGAPTYHRTASSNFESADAQSPGSVASSPGCIRKGLVERDADGDTDDEVPGRNRNVFGNGGHREKVPLQTSAFTSIPQKRAVEGASSFEDADLPPKRQRAYSPSSSSSLSPPPPSSSPEK